MADIAKEKVEAAKLVTDIPVTDVLKDSKAKRADLDFKVALGIIVGAWLILFALVWSLKDFNV